MDFRLNGQTRHLDLADVHAAAARSSPEPLRQHWVVVNGHRWPPKQLLEAATGIPRPEFTSHIALRLFRRLGYTTSTLPADPGATAQHDSEAVPPSALTDAEQHLDIVDADDSAEHQDHMGIGSFVAEGEVGRLPGEAFQTLVAFLADEELTPRIARLEAALAGSDRAAAAELAADSGMSPDLIGAALLVRRHAGRINDIIHAAAITQTLPLILEDGEHVKIRPSLASGNDSSRPFDVETNRRVAEFKLAVWKGADAMRMRNVVADLVHLALADTGRRSQLFVVGTKPIRFLRTSTMTMQWALGRASPILREQFTARFGDEPILIKDFTANNAAGVELIDLTAVLPALSGLLD